jgi:peptidyl-prolyl cis-trans isomerase D
MFEFIRSHQRLMQFLLLVLIVPSFVIGGVMTGYSRLHDDKDIVAKVAGQNISQQEWDAALRSQMNRMREMYGPRFDPKMLETPEAKQNILEGLIGERAMKAEADHSKLAATQEQIAAIVLANFPDLKDASLPKEERVKRYNAYAQNQGMSVPAFEVRVGQSIMLQSLNAAIQSTAFAPKSVTNRMSDLNDQEREIEEMPFKSADFVSKVNITDEMLKTYYDKNGQEFQVPELVQIEYVVLNNDALASQVSVTDDDVKGYYEQNAKRYTTEEQRRASHILIPIKKDASAADKAAAKTKAESLLAQVRKNPADFAKLAKENSGDTGSAERGGDLDYFGKGMMVKPFEDAAYKMKEGEISDLVLSDFGYHIIQITGIKPAAARSLDDVKAEITAEIKAQQISKKYAEVAEIFTNTVYEQADSLKPVAEKLKLKIESAGNLTRQPNPTLPPAALYNNPKFLTALFSDEALKNKHNTEAVEVAPNTLIAGHVVGYKPATKRPFAEVKDILRAHVTQIEAGKLAEKAGEDKLAALKAKDDSAGFSAAKTVTRINSQNIDPVAAAAVMKADVAKLPAYAGVDLPRQGYSVFRISKVAQAANPDKSRRQAEQQQIADVMAQQEMVAYIELLKHKAKAEILKPLPPKASVKDGDQASAPDKK